MGRKKYDWKQLEVEFINSDFRKYPTVCSFMVDKLGDNWRNLGGSRKAVTGWLKKRTEARKALSEAVTKEQLEEPMQDLKRGLKKIIHYILKRLDEAEMVQGQSIGAQSLKHYWEILRTEAGLVTRITKEEYTPEEVDQDEVFADLIKEYENLIKTSPGVHSKGSKRVASDNAKAPRKQ